MKVQQEIEQKLTAEFSPAYLSVVNESHMHSVPENSETHFKVVLASDVFDGKRKVARHQAVYKVLAEELAGEVHALAMHLYSPAEWVEVEQVADSPNCMGGSKHG